MDLEFAFALVGGVLMLLVLMSPAGDRGRRPVYTTVGTDWKRLRARRGQQSALRRVAPSLTRMRPVRGATALGTPGPVDPPVVQQLAQPVAQPVAMATVRVSSQARAVDPDQLVAGLVNQQRTA